MFVNVLLVASMLPLPGDIPLPQPIHRPHGILKKSGYSFEKYVYPVLSITICFFCVKLELLMAFVQYCGQRSSLLWTSSLRPCSTVH